MIKNFKWLKNELEVLAAAVRVLLQIWPKFRFFPKDVSTPVEVPPLALVDWKTVYCALLKCPDLILVDFGTFFFWPKIFSKAMAWNREFWLKTLSGSSGAHQTQTELRKSQGWNLLHEYPKVMPNWDRGDKPDLSYFEKMQKKIFLRLEAPKNVKFLDIFIQT